MLCHVALAAGRRDVQAEKRIARQVVVEVDLRPPADGMTLVAGLFHRRAVGIVGAVAANALCPKLLHAHICGVTGMTLHLGVRSRERKLRMAVTGHPPEIVAVTIPAREAEAALMAVISPVAADAALLNRGM